MPVPFTPSAILYIQRLLHNNELDLYERKTQIKLP